MNVLALCAGYSGLELGLDAVAGGDARVVCYVEREVYAASVLVARMESGELATAPIWSDLATFDATPWGGVVDIITAGFPCQPFSQAGKGHGENDERWLWPAIARIIRVVRPRLVALENVPGLARLGLGTVLGDLSTLGFDAQWSVLRASDVGAPHIRRRLFLLARASGDAGLEPTVPRPTTTLRSDQHATDTDGQSVWDLQQRTTPRRLGVPVRGQTEPRNSRTSRASPDSHGLRQPQPKGREPQGWRRTRDGGWRSPVPAVCRMDDGCANRLDRLRALGNGVVPVQAARALDELWKRLDE